MQCRWTVRDDDNDVVVIHTERAGHARELVKDLVLSDWYGIVVVSGDGLIFEVRFQYYCSC